MDERFKSSNAPGRLVLRADLSVQPSQSGNAIRWVVSDAVRGRHFIVSEIEHWILEQCRWGSDPASLLRALRRNYPDQRVTADALLAFLARAVQDGLLIRKGTNPWRPEGNADWSRRFNPLAIRLPGIDPSWFLARILPAVDWIFSPTALAIWGGLGICGLVTILGHWDRMLADLEALRDGWSSVSSVAVITTIALTKVIHELSHALVCHHLGGRCREMGVLLLMLTPALYCDVSDAWAFRRLSSRVWVSLAGVLAELVMAAIAAILWSTAQPGPLRSAALLVMTTCSVASLAVNLNPLVNHDGYYILADLLAIPNLASESSHWWGQRLRTWLLDLPSSATDGGQKEWIVPIYGVVSIIYRLCITVVMVIALNHVLDKQGLAPVGAIVTVTVLCGFATTPIIFVWRLVGDTRSRRLIVGRRMAAALTSVMILLAVVIWLPLPRHLVAPAIVEPDSAESIFIPVAGRLVKALPALSRVSADQPILWLSDPDLESRLLRIQTDERVLQRRLDLLLVRRIDDVSLGESIPALEESLAGLRFQIEMVRTELGRLTVCARCSGVLLDPPPRNLNSGISSEKQLSRLACSPLESQAIGAFLERGEIACQVGSGRLKATLSVPESDVELLSPGQSVQLRLTSRLENEVQGTILDIEQTSTSGSMEEFSARDEFRPQMGRALPVERRYQVTVLITGSQPPWPLGASAWGRVEVEPASLGTRFWQSLCRALRME